MKAVEIFRSKQVINSAELIEVVVGADANAAI